MRLTKCGVFQDSNRLISNRIYYLCDVVTKKGTAYELTMKVLMRDRQARAQVCSQFY